MNNIWICSGNTYTQISADYNVEPSLCSGVYNIRLEKDGFHLERYADKFIFPYKVYGIQKNFISYVISTYKSTQGNMGILLTGLKGTGKTVTAKELANKLNLPVIIVKDMGENNQFMIEFLSSINCDCILFIDEFEKNFSDSDSTILQIMDGVYNSEHRKLFLLTTNSLRINNNLLGRPSRIRYILNFSNLDLEIVNEYLDDNLNDQEYRSDILEFIDTLALSTIDILKVIVEEINIHGKNGLEGIKNLLNVEEPEYFYYCIRGYAYIDEIEEDKDSFSINSFIKHVESKEGPANSKFHHTNYHQCVYSDIKFQNIKIGDYFNGESVIDKKNNVLVTQFEDNIIFYYVNNPNAENSIYKHNESLVL